MSKQSSSAMSSLAARILRGYQPTSTEVRSLAASVLSQDTTKEQGKQGEMIDEISRKRQA